jgi:hypothetical protein
VRAELAGRVRALLVDGDPRTARREDELFYLETALAPGERTGGGLELLKATADELASVRLGDVDVVALCNVRALEPTRAKLLSDWVHAGGGLLVTMGDNVDVDAWNTSMRGLLPLTLQAASTLAPPNATAKERDDAAEHIAAKLDLGHPVLSVFDAGALRGLRAARFHRVMLTASAASGSDRRVLMRFVSGAPALVEARLGKGRLMFFASSIDRDWTDLPIVPAYLPLMQQIARYLARAPMSQQRGSVLVGESTQLPVDPDDVRVEVLAPDGHKIVFDGERLRGRASVQVTDTTSTGVYRVSAQRAEGQLRPRPGVDFVVNLDPRASDVRRVDAARLPKGGSATAPGEQKQMPKHPLELWHALAAGLLGLLVLEGAIGRR